MKEMFTKMLDEVIANAWYDARTNKQEYILIENLLLCALETSNIQSMMKKFEIDTTEINLLIKEVLNNTPKVSTEKEPKEVDDYTDFFYTLVDKAMNTNAMIDGEDLLVAMFKFSYSYVVDLLTAIGLDDYMIIEYITHKEHSEDINKQTLEKSPKSINNQSSTLNKFSINLTKHALEGKIDPIIGREEEALRAVEILCRKKKNNILFIGESGVGKTSIIEKLALDIVNKKVPNQIADWEIYSIDITSMISGTEYRGEFEKRLQNVLRELEVKENSIAFFDEFHTLFGLGANNSESLDATNILKPALLNEKIRIVGATTYDDAKGTVEHQKSILRRFSKIDISEPNEEDTFNILKGLRKTYSTYHAVTYSDEILKQIVSLSAKHIKGNHFPDKAIDIMDEVGSVVKLKNKSNSSIGISQSDIVDSISKKARVPIDIQGEGDEKIISNLEENMKSKLYGQNHVVEEITQKVILARAGLNEESKPMGAFLLAGPTGVGKTELARQLSIQLGNQKILRYDMSEFMEETSVAKFTGSAQGYVGYEEGGRLINDIRQYPNAILLIDEFEKAHPKIQNIFLQILEEAELTSSDGTKADFRNIFILFTTNAGSKTSKSVGFVGNTELSKSMVEVKQEFSPEFRNRLDNIIQFNPLEKKHVIKVLDKIFGELKAQLKVKKIAITISKAAKEVLAEKGFDPEMGARPMKRVVQTILKQPISKEMIFGKLKDGGIVKVGVDKTQEIYIEYILQDNKVNHHECSNTKY